MAIELLYRVTNRAGVAVGTYASKRIATSVEKRIEAIDTLADRIAADLPDLTEEQRTALVTYLVDNRKDVAGLLGSIKDMPENGDDADDADEDDADETEAAAAASLAAAQGDAADAELIGVGDAADATATAEAEAAAAAAAAASDEVDAEKIPTEEEAVA